jgi:3-hydroxyacyl-[acyl-carrier-protein] dehydratase
MQLDYFQLIDRVLDLNIEAKTITVEAQVPPTHTIFEGHFPGFPIMPGVLLTEAMAQSSGWLLLGLMKFERMPFLAMVKEAKMRGFVSPGQLLTIDAKIEHEGSGFAVTSAKGRVGKELKCSAELTFRLIAFPDPAFRVYIDAMIHKIGFPQTGDAS